MKCRCWLCWLVSTALCVALIGGCSEETKDKASEAATQAGEALEAAGEAAASVGADVVDETKEALGDAAEATKEALGDAAEATEEAAAEAKEKLEDRGEEFRGSSLRRRLFDQCAELAKLGRPRPFAQLEQRRLDGRDRHARGLEAPQSDVVVNGETSPHGIRGHQDLIACGEEVERRLCDAHMSLDAA